MLAWRKTPTLHGVEAVGCVAGFSLLTAGDVLRKVVGLAATIFLYIVLKCVQFV